MPALLLVELHAAPGAMPLTRLKEYLKGVNDGAAGEAGPRIEVLPLPTSAQFLNVIESVFSGLARASLHNSDYASVADAQAAFSRYLDERNAAFRKAPRSAGQSIWGKERVPSTFDETKNCKDPRWIGW